MATLIFNPKLCRQNSVASFSTNGCSRLEPLLCTSVQFVSLLVNSTILQLIGQPRNAASVHCIHLTLILDIHVMVN